MKEQALLDGKLAELETEGDDKRFEDAREELSARLAEVHARLSEMDAESGPARAAVLLAGTLSIILPSSRRLISFQDSGLTKQTNRNLPSPSVVVGGKEPQLQIPICLSTIECDWPWLGPSSSRFVQSFKVCSN